MRLLLVLELLVTLVVVGAQNCGPSHGNSICEAGKCCSQYGWCDTGAAWCDPATCLPSFSGPGSSCTGLTPAPAPASTPTSSSTSTASHTSSRQYSSVVPEIDVCGSAIGGVSCPGAGIGGYFYRCCSSGGHCGPKNVIQDQALYCGAGCQAGFGECVTTRIPPPRPTDPLNAPAQNGETCGPIVNRKCAAGLCCSGSNFCGTGIDFCGKANWCQASWGKCGK